MTTLIFTVERHRQRLVPRDCGHGAVTVEMVPGPVGGFICPKCAKLAILEMEYAGERLIAPRWELA